jgi:CRP/FNR family nitrogen fixation transcriptional regulator
LHQAAPQRSVPRPCVYPFLGSVDAIGFVNCYRRSAEIFAEEEQVKYFYRVVSGAVRTYKTLENGRRLITAFYVPGDAFGLETRGEHRLSGQAISASKLFLIGRSAFVARAARDSRIANQLWTHTAAELQRVQDHIRLFAMPARERVAGFLVDMAKRLSADGEVELPMVRQDIADYLGLTIETVSRSLTQLEDLEAIGIRASRHILLRNYRALVQLST